MMKRFLLLATLFTVILSSSCSTETESAENANRDESNNMIQRQVDTMQDIRYDVDKLQEWFPNLSGIESAEWEVYPDGKNDFPDIPSRGSFAAKGFITISDEKAQEYKDKYEWAEANPEVEFKYVSSEKLNNSKWLFSWYFDNDFRPKPFIGYFWFDGKTVLFDVGK